MGSVAIDSCFLGRPNVVSLPLSVLHKSFGSFFHVMYPRTIHQVSVEETIMVAAGLLIFISFTYSLLPMFVPRSLFHLFHFST